MATKSIHDTEIEELQLEAKKGEAGRWLERLRQARIAQRGANSGLSQREIAELMKTSQPQVHRLLRSLDDDILMVTPEEVIYQACVSGSDRTELVKRLCAFSYTDGKNAPTPHEGRIPGTWDQVHDAFLNHFITEPEYEEVRNARRR